MIQAKCIYKFKNKNNVIIGYRLQDINGVTQDVMAGELKSAIKEGKINVVNLKLTKDDRLIDTNDTKQLKDTNLFTVSMAEVSKYEGVVESDPIQYRSGGNSYDALIPEDKVPDVNKNTEQALNFAKDFATKIRDKCTHWKPSLPVKVSAEKNTRGYINQVTFELFPSVGFYITKRNGEFIFMVMDNSGAHQVAEIGNLITSLNDRIHNAIVNTRAKYNKEVITNIIETAMDKIIDAVEDTEVKIIDSDFIYDNEGTSEEDDLYSYNVDYFCETSKYITEEMITSRCSDVEDIIERDGYADIGFGCRVSVVCDYQRTKINRADMKISIVTRSGLFEVEYPGLDLTYYINDILNIDADRVKNALIIIMDDATISEVDSKNEMPFNQFFDSVFVNNLKNRLNTLMKSNKLDNSGAMNRALINMAENFDELKIYIEELKGNSYIALVGPDGFITEVTAKDKLVEFITVHIMNEINNLLND